MPPAGALFSPISVAFGSMFQTIQCVNKPRGASGSSTIKTSDFASLGTPLIFSSGFTFAPLQVNFAATSPPAWNAGVVTEMEEAAFILRIVPTKIARANEIGFIEQTLAAACRGSSAWKKLLRARTRRNASPTATSGTTSGWKTGTLPVRPTGILPVGTSAPDDMLEACRPRSEPDWRMAGSLTSAGVKPGTTQPYFSMAGKQKTDLRAEILRLIRDPK